MLGDRCVEDYKKVRNLMAAKNLTPKEACEQLEFKVVNYYGWLSKLRKEGRLAAVDNQLPQLPVPVTAVSVKKTKADPQLMTFQFEKRSEKSVIFDLLSAQLNIVNRTLSALAQMEETGNGR